ncbi:VOC family protein [Gordonia sp. ABSL1-1]|uniref:VOC family protein n=1 Tax=Gordonia sp. ABSL1-1 TaxID=3053923 RepID=UPI0025731FA0|nr:VOC family protein [Gordonia sp. ABSL1-1]MDL9937615.1 VOC family protein [Gordonia sp. ABSL1-1]
MHVRWLSAFLDFPAAQFGPEVTFWRAIAGSTVSPPRGAAREFASLEPFNGDPHLRVQRIVDGPGGVHLDLHVDDPRAASLEATALGAEVIRDSTDYLSLRSPAGFVFCLVQWAGESTRSRPIRWPGDAISIIDQVSIDVPRDLFDAEVIFWTRLTGWATRPGTRPEFVALRREKSLALGILLQRLDDVSALDTNGRPTQATGHLDLATNSVTDEVIRHEDWGARVVEKFDNWTTMADPVGRRYCITNRNPRTGD